MTMTTTTTKISAALAVLPLGLALGCPSATPPGSSGMDTDSGGISMTLNPSEPTETGTSEPTGSTDPTGTSAPTTDATETVDPDTTATSTATETETTEPTSTDPSESDSDTEQDSGSTTEDVVPCDVAEATLEPVPPNVMLVLDKSGSMVNNSWDHDAMGGTPDITRWDSLYQVVDFVTTTFDSQINFGAVLFPAINATSTYNAAACTVGGSPDVDIASMNSAAILAAIPDATETEIFGGTPATAGVIVGRDHLLEQDPENPRALILVTDGAANCALEAATNFQRFEEYDEQLPVVVGNAWTADGIPVYVVGIDVEDVTSDATNDGYPNNTNTYDALNEVAVAGGQPLPGMEQFYQTTNQLELQDALQAIISNALSCVVPLDPEPAFPDLLEVIVSNMNVPQVMDCATEDVWVYSNPMGPYDSIELCGTWCDELKAAGSVTAEYYCDPG